MSFPAAAAIWAAMVGSGGLLWRVARPRRAAIPDRARLWPPCSLGSSCSSPRPAFCDRVQRVLRARGGIVAPLVPLFAVLIYAFGVTCDWRSMLIGAAYTVVPAIWWRAAPENPAGTWEDYAAVLIIWLPVEFRWMYRLFPYPPVLTHTLTILLALSTGVAAFVSAAAIGRSRLCRRMADAASAGNLL